MNSFFMKYDKVRRKLNDIGSATCHFLKHLILVSRNFNILGIILLVSFVSSCKQQQKIPEIPSKCNLPLKNAKALTIKLKENEFQFDQLNAKLNAEVDIDSTFHTFSISLRIRKDSIIWMSMSKMGIEGARILITSDSVCFMNRIDKTFFKGDYSYLSQLLNVQLDYELLQSILVGNSVSYYDDDEKIKAGVKKCQYLLGTIRKSKLRKVIEKGKELKEPAQIIYLDAKSFKISQIQFHEFNPDRNFGASFTNFLHVDTVQVFPSNINYQINAEKNIKIAVVVTKIRIDKGPQSYPFSIPENYEIITYNEK